MFEQDYVLRLIKEIVRAILKLLFHIDTENPTQELLEEEKGRSMLNGLLDMVDAGEINEAENMLFEMTSGGDKKDIEIALLFYSYLNDKSDEFLQKHNFSREEILTGVKNFASGYGLSGMVDAFLIDS